MDLGSCQPNGCLCRGEDVLVVICYSFWGIFFLFFYFILTCLGNCGNPDELSFLYLRINFLRFAFWKHSCAFFFGYKHSCVFLGFSQNSILVIKHCIMPLNTTVLLRGMGRMIKVGTPWIHIEIKSHLLPWLLTPDTHTNGRIFSGNICVSVSTVGKEKKGLPQD